MIILGFAAVMAIIYFVVPVAMPGYSPTLMQSAAITLLAFTARVVLTESISVKVNDLVIVSAETTEGEDE
jgi:hypothetical protein